MHNKTTQALFNGAVAGLALCTVLGCSDNTARQPVAETPVTEASSSPANAVLPDRDLAHTKSIVWAVNIGGEAYTGADGTLYEADNLGLSGRTGLIEQVLGTQDIPLYQSYQQGEFSVDYPIANGLYDIIFKFAEPEDIAIGGRTFDVLAEGQTVIENMDVRLARDGKHHSALARAATDIEVSDGELNISFAANAGEPILSGLVVRKKQMDDRQWRLVWQDEFDKNGQPDSSKWSFDEWPARKVNDEDQAYTARSKNARVEDGLLIIEAHKEQYDNAEYTSARLHTLDKGDLLYGKIDVRAKLPAGQGTWAAIWMLPSDPFRYATTCGQGEDWQGSATCDAWPNSGEIDIMEHVGYDMDVVHGTVHNEAYYWRTWQQRKASIEGKNVSDEFHVYSLEWSPELITISMDGSPYFFYRNEHQGWNAWPYDHPFHLILNLAIGGAWGRAGGPIDDSLFPVRMEVDYVRMFKPDSN